MNVPAGQPPIKERRQTIETLCDAVEHITADFDKSGKKADLIKKGREDAFKMHVAQIEAKLFLGIDRYKSKQGKLATMAEAILDELEDQLSFCVCHLLYLTFELLLNKHETDPGVGAMVGSRS